MSASETGQPEILAFLQGGALGLPVERIDTHGAVVLLAGDRAFKLKRAVSFSFMDLSTLADRETAIRRELELNRRTAPQLYRRVLPVTRERDGRLALDGDGQPVEWLLEMRRFPQDAQLDRVAARGELSLLLVETLARTVAELHERAPVQRKEGGAASMRAVVEGNASDLAELCGDILDEGEVALLVASTAEELARRAGLLDARARDGLVRHCHGDLHLANVVLLPQGPVPFDCLEFSDELATIDLLYDLAFLLMDLLERGLTVEAHRCLQIWGEIRQDDQGQALLPLFLAVRATIRAKVAGFAARLAEAPADGREAAKQRARTYLAFARRTLQPAPPRLVAIGGRSGTGKSSVAMELAPSIGAMPGAFLLRSDVVRKTLFGLPPTARLPASAYDAAVSRRVYARLASRAATLLRAGRTVIADAVWGDAWQAGLIHATARRCGVPFDAFWLDAPEAVLVDRVAGRKHDASDADAAVVRRQAGLCAPDGWTVVDATGSVPATAEAIEYRLGRSGASVEPGPPAPGPPARVQHPTRARGAPA